MFVLHFLSCFFFNEKRKHFWLKFDYLIAQQFSSTIVTLLQSHPNILHLSTHTFFHKTIQHLINYMSYSSFTY